MSTTTETRGYLPESWKVDLPIFEGPLDLLLELVRLHEVEITEIPVRLVCDQYHEYLALMEELDLDIAGEYIYEAALLIQIKARTLLPTAPLSEEDGAEDPREELIRRLLEYQQLKEAAQSLAETDTLRAAMWTRTPQEKDFLPAEATEESLDLEEISLYDVLRAFQTTLERYDREHPEPLHYSGEVYSIRDQFERFLGLIEAGRPFELVDDLLALRSRGEVVAAFLAVLELCRLQLVRVHQTDAGAILLYRTTRRLDPADLRAIQS